MIFLNFENVESKIVFLIKLKIKQRSTKIMYKFYKFAINNDA